MGQVASAGVGHASDSRFLVLHGLRLKGFAEPPAIATAVGLDAAAVEDHLADLQADDLVLRRDSRLVGWALTAEGRREQQRLALEDVAANGAEEAVRLAYERFLASNALLLAACTDWQVRAGVPNDHRDAAHEAEVLGRLRAIHDAIVPVLDDLAAALDRFAGYRPRFTAAIEALAAGDLDRFTKPIIDSYHTIWFELHEDLLTSLGIERSQEGAA